MTQDKFAAKIMKCSGPLFSQVLKGKRNFSFKKAKAAAHIFGTSIDVWMDAKSKDDRVAAWEKFKEELL